MRLPASAPRLKPALLAEHFVDRGGQGLDVADDKRAGAPLDDASARELPQAASHGFPMGTQAAREIGVGRRWKDDRAPLSRRDLAGKAQQLHLDPPLHREGAELDHALREARTRRASRRRIHAFTDSCGASSKRRRPTWPRPSCH
jgi:hypothetical protein